MSGNKSSLPVSEVAEAGFRSPEASGNLFSPTQILADCNDLLNSLATSSEEEFLFIGARLQDFQGKADRISQVASTVSLLISGDEISSAIDGMQQLMKRISVFTSNADEDLSRIVSVLENITLTMDSVLVQNSEMHSIGRVLFRHGLMIGVENATCGHRTEGMLGLGDEVKKLSATASVICQRVQENINLMNEMIQESLLRVESHRQHQKVRGAHIIERASETLKWLENHYRLAASGATAVESSTRKIGQSVINIVTHLQFHDITRQDWERLKLELSAVHSAWQHLPSGPGSDPSPQLCSETILFADYACEQVRHTSSDFLLAVQVIKENLGLLSSLIRGMLNDIKGLVQQEDNDTQAFLTAVRRNLSWISTSVPELFRHGQVMNQLGDLIAGIGKLCRDMTAHLNEVEEIGDDIHLISLNAVIQSDAIGISGRSLEVIADSIQRISNEARDVAQMISGLLKKTIDLSEDFASIVQEVNGRISLQQKEMTTDLRRLPSALEAINSQVGRMLQELTAEGHFLAARIDEVMDRVQADRESERYSEILTGLFEKIRYAAEEAGIPVPEKEAFSSRYPIREIMIDPVSRTIRNPGEAVTPGDKEEIELF